MVGTSRACRCDAFDPKLPIGTQICCDARPSSHVVGCDLNGAHMRRRELITRLGGGAAAWPVTGRAQRGRVPVVGVLRPTPKDTDQFPEPFRRSMRAIGWEDGRNVRFLFVWAEGRNERAPALAEELVAQNVDLIITFGNPAIRATQRATQAIPIVGMTDDMVSTGLDASMARPTRHTPGVSIHVPELYVNRLE